MRKIPKNFIKLNNLKKKIKIPINHKKIKLRKIPKNPKNFIKIKQFK